MTDRSIVVRLRADVADYVRNIKAAGDRTREASGDLGKYVEKNSAHISSLSNTVGLVGAAMTGVAVLAVKKFADFDAAMSNVAATGEDARGSIDALRRAALDAGAQTVFSATEAAAAVENLAKAGVSASDIMGGGLAGSLDLAAAGSLDVADAAEIAATTMSQFGLQGADMAHVADLLAAGAGKAQGDVSDMSMALKQSGLVAAQFGLSVEDTVGTLTAFASAGLLGSDAGTSFRTMLLRMANPSKEAAGTMKELGIAAYDAQGNFVGMSSLAEQLRTKLAPLTQEQRDAALATIFGSDAIRAANVLYKEGAAGIDAWTKKVDDQGYAAEVARIKLDNLKGDLEALSGSFETALIGMGEGANGPLRSLVQNATDVVNAFGQMPAGAQQAVLGIVGGGGLVLLGVAGLGKLVVSISTATSAMVEMGFVSEATAGKLTTGAVKGAKVVGKLGAAFAAAALAAQVLGEESDPTSADQWTKALLKTTAAGDLAAMSLDGIAGETYTLAEAFQRINAAGTWQQFDDFSGDLIGMNSSMDLLTDEFGTLGQSLAQLFATDPDLAAEKFRLVLDQTGAETGELLDLMPAYRDALAAASNEQTLATDSTETLTAATQEQTDAQAEALEKWREMAAGADESFVNIGDAYQGVIDKTRDWAEQTAEKSKDTEDTWQDYYDGVSVSSADYIAQLQEQVTAQENWEKNLLEISARVAAGMSGDMRTAAEEMIDELIALGPEGAAQVQLLHDMSEPEFEQVVTLWSNKGTEAVTAFTDQVHAFKQPVIGVTADTTVAQTTVNSFITSNTGKRIQVSVDAVGGTTYSVANSGVRYNADGGYVTGPGTARSDSIPARLSNGEYVINAAAVSRVGVGFLNNINRRRFADGGEVSAWPSSSSAAQYAAGAPANVTIEGAHMTGTLDMGNGLVGVIDARVARGFAEAARAGAGTRSSAGRVR